MQKRIQWRELVDPVNHSLRGILFFDGEVFTFTAHRQPYQRLNNKTWETEQEFKVDYRQLTTGRG